MRAGDSIPGLVGWEYHGDPAPIAGLEVVASGPTQQAPEAQWRDVYCHHLSWSKKQLRLQCSHNLVGGWVKSTAPGYVRPQVYTGRFQKVPTGAFSR